MEAKTAIRFLKNKIKKESPIEKIIEFPDFFVISFKEEFDSSYSVRKSDGKIEVFFPPNYKPEELKNGKEIQLKGEQYE